MSELRHWLRDAPRPIVNKFRRCCHIATTQQAATHREGRPCPDVSYDDWLILAARMRRVYDYGDSIESAAYRNSIEIGRVYLRSLNA